MTINEWIENNVATLGSLAVGGLAAAIWAGVRGYVRSIRDTWQKMASDNAAQGQALIEQGEAIKVIKKQVLPNGGKSLSDGIARLEAKFEVLAASDESEFKHRKDAAVRVDAEGEIKAVTEGYFDMTGVDTHAARNCGWHKAIHPRDLARVIREWGDTVKYKRHGIIRYRHIHKARGEMVSVESTVETLRSPAPNPTGGPRQLLGWDAMINPVSKPVPFDETAPDPYAS